MPISSRLRTQDPMIHGIMTADIIQDGSVELRQWIAIILLLKMAPKRIRKLQKKHAEAKRCREMAKLDTTLANLKFQLAQMYVPGCTKIII